MLKLLVSVSKLLVRLQKYCLTMLFNTTQFFLTHALRLSNKKDFYYTHKNGKKTILPCWCYVTGVKFIKSHLDWKNYSFGFVFADLWPVSAIPPKWSKQSLASWNCEKLWPCFHQMTLWLKYWTKHVIFCINCSINSSFGRWGRRSMENPKSPTKKCI